MSQKLNITKKHFGKSIREILIDLNISPEVVLVKINKKFIPISKKIKKETELEIIEVTKN